jgi:hypothetical protein
MVDIQPSEVNMIVTNYTPENLKKLPLRAIVALAVRCARQVENLALLPGDHPETQRCRAAATNAILLAEDFAKGQPCSSSASVLQEMEACRAVAQGDFTRQSAMGAIALAARAAATAERALEARVEKEQPHLFGGPKPNPFPHLGDVTADLAARDAFTAALEAADAEGHSDAFIKGAMDDYEKLVRLDLGSYPQAGKPIDPSGDGPLGPREPVR